MDVVGDLMSKLDAIVDEVFKAMEPPEGQTRAQQRQFIAGYVNLVAESAKGNNAPCDDYLATVIPGIKQSGMPLDYVLGGMTVTAMAIAAHVAPDHRTWHIAFGRSYTERLIREWAAA